VLVTLWLWLRRYLPQPLTFKSELVHPSSTLARHHEERRTVASTHPKLPAIFPSDSTDSFQRLEDFHRRLHWFFVLRKFIVLRQQRRNSTSLSNNLSNYPSNSSPQLPSPSYQVEQRPPTIYEQVADVRASFGPVQAYDQET
jgi:hypothetical protein